MIVKKHWYKGEEKQVFMNTIMQFEYTGYFLFGFIPLYVVKTQRF